VAGLAEQSSLLALNAAIEASRAGEQGSRLAGVAHQVRQVAERSKVAVEQMQEILNEAQPGTNSAVTVPGERATGTTPLAEQAADAARLVASGLESTAQANAHIAAAAQQQIAQIAQIGDALGTIQQATSESLAGTRKTEHAAQELTTLAQFLQHALTAYRV
jgi:methyl-accepting chemotaxis protein